MLTTFRVQNFKCWKDTGEIKLAPLTAFFGGNSSGKSSILQMLLILAQTTGLRDQSLVLNLGRSQDDWVQAGTFRSLLHAGPPSPLYQYRIVQPRENRITVSISWTPSSKLKKSLYALVHYTENVDQNSELDIDEVHFDAIIESDIPNIDAGIAEPVNGIHLNSFKYSFKEMKTGKKYGVGMQRQFKQPYTLIDEGLNLQSIQNTAQLPLPVQFYGFPDRMSAFYTRGRQLYDLEEEFDDQFDRIVYLGPLRAEPAMAYQVPEAGTVQSDVGKRGEFFVAAIVHSRPKRTSRDLAKENRTLSVEEQIASWLIMMGLVRSFQIEEIGSGSNQFQVRVQVTANSPSILLPNVGFGVSQVLPVLTLLATAPENSIVIMEQPEMHLHPKAQSDLADVLIDAIKNRRIQIILESHSEHLLTRLQRRMSEYELSEEGMDSNMASLYFCSKGENGSYLTSLNLDEYGNISNWPDDFFGNELSERSAMLDAEMERRKLDSVD